MLLYLLLVTTIFSCADGKEIGKDLGTVIGIDLGTTYTCVGIFKNCHVEIIENDQGNRITPSCVGFAPDGERLIGDAAKNLLTSNPSNTIFQIKRIIGRKFNDSSVQRDIKNFPFLVVENNRKPVVKVDTRYGDKLFTPEEISAMILGKMRDIAEKYLRIKVRHAVVTVPAYFNDAQRQATKDAGTIAGLNVIRIINEPTAAAIAYGLDKLNAKGGEKNILVYDLGGGTFDVSILTLDNGVFQVQATNGDTHLGGEDFDQRIMDYFIALFKKKTGKDVRKQTRSIEKLRREVEKAKRILSSEHQAKIEIEFFYQNEEFIETLTRAKFEELNMDLFRATMVPVANVLKDAKLEKSDIAEVLLVGGSTRIPKVREILKKYFDGKEPARSINPDEAVAHGAAIQAGILSGEKCTEGMVVIDVNPLTMGIETVDGIMAEIIPRNSEIPITKTKQFTTATDFQESVNVQVFEGERPKTKDNHFLGQFELTGITIAARGVPEIDVIFDIDVNGILNVTAQEKDKGIKKSIIINSKTNQLSQNEINRMIRDSEIFAEGDKKIKDRADAKNDFESYVYSLRNQLNDPTTTFGQLPSAEKKTIADAVEQQVKWLDLNPTAKIDELLVHKKQLQQVVIRIITNVNSEFVHSNDTDSQQHRYEL